MQQIMGTETEFGILARDGGRSDHVANSLQLIAHYPSLLVPRGIWDYENENPLLDARDSKLKANENVQGRNTIGNSISY